MRILGISACGRDSAAALIRDGAILAAAQQERFTRRKHDGAFPDQAIAYCLGEVGCRLADVDWLAVHGAAAEFPATLPRDRVVSVDPAVAHAASAFFPGPFATAAILVLDTAITATAMGDGNRLDLLDQQPFPHSLGRFYSAITRHIGFRAGSGEYKVMGLAPYGEPKYAARMLERMIAVAPDGIVSLDLSYFGEAGAEALAALFGQPQRRTDRDPLTRFHMDMAASAQAVTEQVMLARARSIATETGARTLCLAGGVALNCVANGKLARAGIFEDIWIQPAAGNAGTALGAALAAYHRDLGGARGATGRDAMQGCYLGPAWTQAEIERRLAALGARFTVLSDDELIDRTVQALAEEKAVGWMQGRMEFGPRALGNRSILGDPRSPTMQKMLNLKVKYRESFRPFAPSVLREDVNEWFELDGDSPYMLLVAPVAERHRRAMSAAEQALFGIDKLNVPRSRIPAVTHVDYSARVQTVHADTNPRYHALISAFKARTGCPVVVNTSFNVRGEPIACTPEDAFRCFMGSEIEVLAVGNCFLKKKDQDEALRLDYKTAFEPD